MVKKIKEVLHIAPHLGGGVGKALSGILEYEKNNNSSLKHKVILLEKPENYQFVDICINNGIEVIIITDCDIKDEIEKTDVVIYHWWHHPLGAALLANFPNTKTRMILWSHINGCTYPMLPFELVKSVNKAFFTSGYTLYNPYWSEDEQNYAQENACVIYGLGKLEDLPFEYSFKKSKENFVIGYVGTLNFSKLNPDFVEYCNEVVKLIPQTKFVMVGNPDGKAKILEDARKIGIEDKFEFIGYTNNVNEELCKFDVFGYPLNNWHFGTTENVILEAINATVPVVALNQCSERYLINHNKTGFLANDKEHYARIMKKLFDNLGQRIRISSNAKTMLKDEFFMQKNIKNMRKALTEVLEQEKKVFDFRFIFGTEPYQWFLSCLGEDREIFEQSLKELTPEVEEKIRNCREILKENSKSSVKHFLKYFGNDKHLQYWDKIIEKQEVNL